MPSLRTLMCDICCNLNFTEDTADSGFSREVSFTSLTQSAQNGCRACTAVHDAIKAYPEPLGMRNIQSLRLYSQNTSSPLFVEPRGPTSANEDPLYVKTLELFVEPGDHPIWPAIGLERDVSFDSSSAQAMNIAKNWLDDCLEKHSNCPSSSHLQDGPLPTRVLDIGPNGTDSRLFITEGVKGNYAALSYCWGPPPHPWKTTLPLLACRTKGIALQDLPKTLQDAVTITYRLGLRYLWIDALCIIQESNDWDAEAGKMGDYYRNATITISADGSEDSHSGCFVRGNRRYSTIIPVLFEDQDAVLHVRAKSAWPLDGSHPPMASKQGIANKLITRGWSLQEHLLSPRILHCTAQEMVWECASAMPCECKLHPDKPIVLLLKNRLIMGNYLPRSLLQAKVSDGLKIVSGLLLRWDNVVYEFTSRDLTYSSDRLPALSGLAAVMQTRNPENTYIAGLWKERLPLWLCWQTQIPPPNSTPSSNRHERYYAPTWSWASTTGGVRMPLASCLWVEHEVFQAMIDIKVDILSVSCTPAGPNLFGNISTGEVRCKGTVIPVTLQKTKATERLYVVSDCDAGGSKPTALVYRDIYEDRGEIKTGEAYILLIVLSHRTARNDVTYPSLVYGILLQKRQLEGYNRVALVIGYPNETIGNFFITDWESVGEVSEVTIF